MQWSRYIEDGQMKSKYPIVIGGENFGCGSSREHAPVAMGAAGERLLCQVILFVGVTLSALCWHCCVAPSRD